MKRSIKTFVSRWMARRIESEARRLRRDLRDYQREAAKRIVDAETRSRGLRLYAAWSRPRRAKAPQPAVLIWEEHQSLRAAA